MDVEKLLGDVWHGQPLPLAARALPSHYSTCANRKPPFFIWNRRAASFPRRRGWISGDGVALFAFGDERLRSRQVVVHHDGAQRVAEHPGGEEERQVHMSTAIEFGEHEVVVSQVRGSCSNTVSPAGGRTL